MHCIDFNDGWHFYKKGRQEYTKIITLPHDAMIEEKRIPQLVAGETSGYFPGGEYIYEKDFIVPEEWDGKKILLEFDGVYQKSVVYLNESEVGRNINGYTRFFVDLTETVKAGEENHIRVTVDNTQIPNSRWYTGSGIYRPVRLFWGEKRYIVPDGIKIRTEDYEKGEILVAVEIANADGNEEVVFDIWLDGKQEKVCAELVGKEKTDKIVVIYRLHIENPELWSAEFPNLYLLKIRLEEKGEVIDEEQIELGIRQLDWSPEYGLRCNGKTIKLRGACVHHDYGILGAAAHKDAAVRRVRILKETGYNAIRTAHNPPDRYILQACDRMGMYIMAEFTDVWIMPKNAYDYAMYFEDLWKYDARQMIRKIYCHPSVVMYSIGNEVAETSNINGEKINKELAEYFRELDQTRPITNCVNILSAMTKPSKRKLKRAKHKSDEIVDPAREGKASPLVSSKLLNMVATMLPKLMLRVSAEDLEKHLGEIMRPLDCIGLNYGTHLSEPLGKKNRNRLVVHSETYPGNIGKTWKETLKYPYIMGDFMWTGMDYLGEAGLGVPQYGKKGFRINKPYPCIAGGVGSINLIGEIEAQGYYSKIVYGEEEGPYIGVSPMQYAGQKCTYSQWRGTVCVNSWAWNGYEGKTAKIEVYSNADMVKLIKNGQSVGVSKVIHSKATFMTVYQPGRIEAVAYDKLHRETGRSELLSAADGRRISITSDRTEMSSNGRDLVFLHIALTDQQGTICCFDKKKVFLRVEGVGELLAVGSGDPCPVDDYCGNTFHTYFGTMGAVIRAGKETGICRITAEAEGYERAVFEIAEVAND